MPAAAGNRLLAGHQIFEAPFLRELLALLSDGADEARIVGGAVRDALLGRAIGDIDIATVIPPDEGMRRATRAGFAVHPTGIAHGTILLARAGASYEVTTLRRDVETDGRRAVVAWTRDFAVDAFRRDFTLNALSATADGTVFDYATGIEDARAGILRFMGEPATRVREDYLRILRFFRFRASLGSGAPDVASLDACRQLKAGLRQLSRERVRAETLKLLAAPGAGQECRLMLEIGVVGEILPGGCLPPLERMIDDDRVLGLRPDALLRLAALSGASASALAALFRLSGAETRRIAMADVPPERSASLRLQLHLAGREALRDRFRLASARSLPGLPPLADLLSGLAATPDPPALPFGGARFMALGLPAGPEVGKAIRRAEALWIEAGLPDDAAAISAIERKALPAGQD
jgi:poly(A) polymerase